MYIISAVLAIASTIGYQVKANDNKIYPEPVPKVAITNSNNFNIFTVTPIDTESEKLAMISLSDVYSDSLGIPAKYINEQQKIPFDQLKSFELETSYRDKLLKATNIKESDTLFLYDYAINSLTKFPVKTLKSIAHLSPYVAQGQLFSAYDYMIGFQINNKLLKKSEENYYNNVLVYIGKVNPFAQKQLKNIKWTKINTAHLPIKFSNKEIINKNYKIGNHYQYQTDNITYLIRDILFENKVESRQFLAIGTKNKNILADYLFANGESTFLSSIIGTTENNFGEQWTGQLFKNKPNVAFGFVGHNFGCPTIMYLDKSKAQLNINCDNRH